MSSQMSSQILLPTSISKEIIYSNEQIDICNSVKEGYNIIVNAVAGSGKTTTINLIARECQDKSIVALLYSKFLATESKSKIKTGNIDVRTIHSFCQKNYKTNCNTDTGLRNLISNKNKYYGSKIDVLIVDEAQDLNPLMAATIRKIIADTNPSNILFFGDVRQCIYKFKGSDSKFLIMADELFNNNNPNWRRLTLSTTYRCTSTMVDFVNNCLLKQDIMVSNRTSVKKPKYYIKNIYDMKEDINEIIDTCLKLGYTCEDIALLAYSVSTNSPIYVVSNYLSSKGKFIFKPMDDFSDLSDETLLKNKIVVSTFHQFKGRERKLVIVFGFDNYFYKMNPDAPINECPNILYVAATRASEQLILVQDKKEGYLKFMESNIGDLGKYVEIVGEKIKSGNIPEKIKDKTYSVTQLIKFLPDTLFENLKDCWNIYQANFIELSDIKYQTVVSFDSISEDVSSIYGTAVPIIKQYYLQKNFILIDALNKMRDKARELNISRELDKLLDEVNLIKDNFEMLWKQIPKIINFYISIQDRYTHRINQIRNYDWFFSNESINAINSGLERLGFLEDDSVFEKNLSLLER